MLQEQLCVECRKSGTEYISRCGHILHEDCFKKMCSFYCPKCRIDLSRDIKVEKVFCNISTSGMDHPRIKELQFCLNSFTDEMQRNKLFSYNNNILGELQKFGWNINDKRFGGPNLFYQACELDDLCKVNLLIEFGIDLNKYGPEGLQKAHTSSDVFERLVKLAVKLNDEIIFDVIEKNNTRMLQRLIKEGIDINLKGRGGMRPIHAAAKLGSINTVTLLNENGADITAKDDEMNSILHYACLSDNGLELVNFLIDSGYNLEILNAEKETPLMFVIRSIYKTDTVTLLIDKGAKIDTQDKTGNSPLHTATSLGKEKFTKILISKGANVNAKNHDGKTPLHLASGSECVNLLLDNDVDINALDKAGNPPLYYLYDSLDGNTLNKFAVKGADFMIENKDGEIIRDLILKRYPEIKI